MIPKSRSEKKKLDRLRKIVVKVGEDKLPSIVDDLCDSEERLMELQPAMSLLPMFRSDDHPFP